MYKGNCDKKICVYYYYVCYILMTLNFVYLFGTAICTSSFKLFNFYTVTTLFLIAIGVICDCHFINAT